MHALMELLAQALGHHGYAVTADAALEGRSGTVYTVPLLAEMDGHAYLIDSHLEGVVETEVLDGMVTVLDDVGADGAVLAHLGAVASHDLPVVTWGRDELVRLLGEAALASATEVRVDAPRMEPAASEPTAPVAETLDQLLPPAFQGTEPEADDFDGPDLQPDAFSLDGLEGLAVAAEDFASMEVATVEAADTPAPVPPSFLAEMDALVDPDAPSVEPTVAAPMDPLPTGEAERRFPLLPVRCTPKEAAASVRERLFEARNVQAVLHPVYLFDYECDLLAEGSLRYDTVQGRIQVHGTHKHVLDVDPEAIDPQGFGRHMDDVPAEEKVLRISEDRAKELGRDFLTEAHTRLVDVEVNNDEQSFSYTEKRKVAPRPDHIRLANRGVFYRVAWRVFGPNGHIDVDGMTGVVQEEALQTPNPDVYIMD